MRNLNLEKIEIKKTKVQMTVSLDVSELHPSDECFRKLLAIAVMNGASSNCVKQLSNIRYSNTAIDFVKAEEVRIGAIDLVQTVEELFNDSELKYSKTHKFH